MDSRAFISKCAPSWWKRRLLKNRELNTCMLPAKNVIYKLKNNMYTPMLEVTAGGGGARAPVPPPLNPPLGVWVLCYRTKRDACYIVYLFTIPQRHLVDNFCIESRCQLLTETFGINFWLKLWVSRFDWNFW